MANISRDTFNALKRYVSVRLQQGVPLVDADWNEKDDIRRFELRAFLKWFVGDGIPARVGDPEPQKNDSFRIVARTAPDNQNDFTILAGGSEEALGAGRCLVDGVEVFITQNTTFVGQPLHEDYSGDETIVDPDALPIERVPVLGAAGTVLVYLDVWEWEIGGSPEKVPRDPELINDALGIETCVRLKRDWAVRVRPGTALPIPGDDDYLAAHSYYALARIERRAGDPAINAEDITDLRRTGITLAEYLKVPMLMQRGGQTLNLQRFAAMLNGLRTVLFDRVRRDPADASDPGRLPYQTANDRDEYLILMALQSLLSQAQVGEEQAATRNLDNRDGLTIMNRLYHGQNHFLSVLMAIGNVDDIAEPFVEEYVKYLDGSDEDLILGLKLALDNQDLLAAVIAQETLNTALSLPINSLPEGSVIALYRSALPFEDLAAGKSYAFIYEINPNFVSPQSEEDFTVQATLEPSDFGTITIDRPSLTFSTPGRRETVTVTVRLGGTLPDGTFAALNVVAASVRNPSGLRSTQLPITLTVGGQPPAGAFFYYIDPGQTENGQLILRRDQLTGSEGRSILFLLRNDSPSQTISYQVTGQVAFSDVSSPVGWLIQVIPTSTTIDVRPGRQVPVEINLRVPDPSSANPAPEDRTEGDLVASATRLTEPQETIEFPVPFIVRAPST